MTREHAFLLGYLGKSASASSFLKGYLEKNAGLGRVVKSTSKAGRYTPKANRSLKKKPIPKATKPAFSNATKAVVGTGAVVGGGLYGLGKAKEYIAKGKEKLDSAGNKSLDERNKSVKNATGKMGGKK